MRARTESETKAYKQGYSDCHKRFCEYLAKMPYTKALEAMERIVVGLNETVRPWRGEDDE
jgi:hypothetical protein